MDDRAQRTATEDPPTDPTKIPCEDRRLAGDESDGGAPDTHSRDEQEAANDSDRCANTLAAYAIAHVALGQQGGLGGRS
jgi:hypothetical protein